MENHTATWNWDHSYIRLNNRLFSEVTPTPVPQPELLIYNSKLAGELGIKQTIDETLLAQLAGNLMNEGIHPIAQAYAGHQFGHFNILGDGRAILLGEHLTPTNERFDIQLKGPGRTPYSRNGDGRATTSAMLREYLISEAMHGLHIPTTRSLAVIKTGDEVYREYVSEGAVLTRVAASHIRVGTFQYAAKYLPKEELSLFCNYVIQRHYPEVANDTNSPLAFLKKVQDKQIDLIVNWMRVGFIHGVMNTDNMSIAGETIDYGPCAFMNTYHPETVFSSIDTQGRYAFGNQPSIAQWNIACFAGSLLSLIHEEKEVAIEMAKEVLNSFPAIYQEKWQDMMFKKLGFSNEIDLHQRKNSLSPLLDWMTKNKADYTNTFLILQGDMPMEGIYLQEDFQSWFINWQDLERGNEEARLKRMRENNPLFIPRNHLVEKALDEACLNDDLRFFKELLDISVNPYAQNASATSFMKVPDSIDTGYKTFCGT